MDLTHLDKRQIDIKLGGILEIYEKFVGEDPRTTPMRIFPGVHYSMGGLWVNFVKDQKTGGLTEGDPRNQMTSIPGLYAVGECDYQYHGANRLGANSLLSCLTAGQLTGPGVVNYVRHLDKSVDDLPSSLFERERKSRQAQYETLAASTGTENPYRLHEELGDVMTENVTVVRYNDRLRATDAKIQELQERAEHVSIADRFNWTNQLIPFTRQLKNMLHLARAVTLGALARDESRGAHYKPDFPKRDDERFLKSTIAEWTPDGPKLSYEAVDTSLIKPRLRNYAAEKDEQPQTPSEARINCRFQRQDKRTRGRDKRRERQSVVRRRADRRGRTRNASRGGGRCQRQWRSVIYPPAGSPPRYGLLRRRKGRTQEAGKSWLTGEQQMDDADPVKASNPVSQQGEKDVNAQ